MVRVPGTIMSDKVDTDVSGRFIYITEQHLELICCCVLFHISAA